jgi:hypothetical protein
MPRARKLISGASFGADTLAILGKVFDEVGLQSPPTSAMIQSRSKTRGFD